MKTDWDKLDYFIDTLEPSQLSLKVVVFDEIDYAYAKDVHKRYPTTSLYLQVGNEDTTTGDQNRLLTQLLDRYEQLINWTMEDTEMNYVRVLPQLHTLLWGNKRGV